MEADVGDAEEERWVPPRGGTIIVGDHNGDWTALMEGPNVSREDGDRSVREAIDAFPETLDLVDRVNANYEDVITHVRNALARAIREPGEEAVEESPEVVDTGDSDRCS